MIDNENDPGTDGDSAVVSVGETFSAARKQQGLTQQQVADRLHLRISSIQAIESDGIEKGVSLTFTKGYVRLYARLLGLHADPLMVAFGQLHAQDTQPAKLQSFSKRVAREANDSRWNMVTYIIVASVIGLVILWWIDQSHFSFTDSFNSSLQAPTQQSGELTPAPVISAAEQNDIVNDPNYSGELEAVSPNDLFSANTPDQMLSQEQSPIAPSQDSEISNDADLESPITVASSAEQTEQTSPAEASDPIALNDQISELAEPLEDSTRLSITRASDSDLPYKVNSDGTVDMVFTFSDDCWVSVKDRFDETVAVGVKVKGRVMKVSGIPPIQVVLGAPQHVAIDFGGQPVDMSEYDGSRSANFQLPIQGE
ncbi:RodZ domain-containing protein [Glaciecola sp. SC05]|uniref:RodZ domain-containing protein n=1 Tax=Glaciecola sp. SC05 TaxID=1987355 RepID=UPI0035293D62